MTPAHQILVGDCLELLRAIPDESVHCYITSPPYFGLRDYGMAGGYPELLIRALNIESTAKAAGNFNSVSLRDLGRRPNRGEYIELVDEAEANDPGAFFLRQQDFPKDRAQGADPAARRWSGNKPGQAAEADSSQERALQQPVSDHQRQRQARRVVDAS